MATDEAVVTASREEVLSLIFLVVQPFGVNFLSLPLIILLGCLVVKNRARLGMASAA